MRLGRCALKVGAFERAVNGGCLQALRSSGAEGFDEDGLTAIVLVTGVEFTAWRQVRSSRRRVSSRPASRRMTATRARGDPAGGRCAACRRR